MTDHFEVHERDGAARLGELRLAEPVTTPALADLEVIGHTPPRAGTVNSLVFRAAAVVTGAAATVRPDPTEGIAWTRPARGTATASTSS